MPRHIQLVLLLLHLHIVAILARTWTSSELPSPQNDPGGVCGRGTVKSSICDPDGYISQADADTVDGLINFVNEGSHGFKKLTCKTSERGAQIAVAVIESMGRGSGSKEDRAFQFAKDVHDRWGVGDADCQNGIVLFFAIKDRSMAISTGAGIKPIFTDAMIPKVLTVMRTKLKKEEYGQGIVDGVATIGNILSTGKAPSVGDDGSGSAFGFFAVILGVIGISSLVSGRKKRRYARCKKLLEKMDDERAAANSKEYVATSCPICLEDFQQNLGSEEKNPIPLAVSEMGSVRTMQVGGATSATTTTATESSSDATKTLPCGHKFHGSCILSWVSGMGASNQLCPICRQPITEDGAGTERVTEMTNTGQPSGWEVYDPEYSFRVRRARYLYSDFVTWNMINSWEADRYNHSHSMATSPVFAAVDPGVVAAAARSSGSGGSSFSFGGGSSGGGGGGGGGW